MPDRDKVHPNLGHRWQKTYMEICEDYFGPTVCAADAMGPLVDTIKGYGEEPIQLLKLADSQLDQIAAGPLLRVNIDWSAERSKIEMAAQRISGNRRGIDLAKRACKEQLREIEQGRSAADTFQELATKYLRHVYDSEFEVRIPWTTHYNGADPSFVQHKLTEMRPFVLDGISEIAQRIVQSGRVDSLQAPHRSATNPPIDLETDLSLNTH